MKIIWFIFRTSRSRKKWDYKMKQEIFEQIVKKKEFSQLPKGDVEAAFSHFEKRQCSDEEKIRLTRELLHKIFGSFSSRKLLSPKNKSEEWILKKHLSTRERFSHYGEIYSKILKNLDGKMSIVDLGAGANGFSYVFFEKSGFKPNYVGVEAVGQLVNLTNHYFQSEKINGKAFHLSLFDLEKIKKLISEQKRPRVVFLFKVIDSLEMLEKNYSKKLLLEMAPICDKIAASFATRSMIKRKKFHANRMWIFNFIKENFKITDEFEIGDEKFIVFENKKIYN